ncbi:MAG: hypothetical protein AAFZ91_14060 [Pseudomonadota bacterium]
MNNRWIWAGTATLVIAVNLYMAVSGNSALPPVFHYVVASAAFVFGLGVIVFSGIQDSAQKKLEAMGLTQSEIKSLVDGDLSEAEALRQLQLRNKISAR